MTGPEAREAFDSAALGFQELVATIRPDDWTRPGLGEWDVRALVGHAGRALSTIESYLGAASEGAAAEGTPMGPAGYYLSALSHSASAEQRRQQDAGIAARGRQAGEALGADPAAAIAALSGRVRALVARTPDTAPIASPAGPMTLATYLPTRTFELTVHSLDLARALGAEPPARLAAATAASCELAGAIAGRRPRAADLLLLLTGREDLPHGLSIL